MRNLLAEGPLDAPVVVMTLAAHSATELHEWLDGITMAVAQGTSAAQTAPAAEVAGFEGGVSPACVVEEVM